MPRLMRNMVQFVLTRLFMPKALFHSTLSNSQPGGYAAIHGVEGFEGDSGQNFPIVTNLCQPGVVPPIGRHSEKKNKMKTTCRIGFPCENGVEQISRRLEAEIEKGVNSTEFFRYGREGCV